MKDSSRSLIHKATRAIEAAETLVDNGLAKEGDYATDVLIVAQDAHELIDQAKEFLEMANNIWGFSSINFCNMPTK